MLIRVEVGTAASRPDGVQSTGVNPVLVHGASNVALPRTLVFLPNRVGLPRSRVDRDRPRDRPVDIERREGHAERQVFH